MKYFLLGAVLVLFALSVSLFILSLIHGSWIAALCSLLLAVANAGNIYMAVGLVRD